MEKIREIVRKSGLPVSNIKVQFGSNSVRTDKDGHFVINAPGASGDLTFTYGDISGLSDKTAIQNALKYNGHDYIAEQAPGDNQTTINVTQETIKQAGKGCSQVYLLIDCSSSMRNNKVTIYGQEKTRLQVLVDSAKQLVDSLINSGENIYIGIVAYSGTCYRARGLTQNKDLLMKDLDYIIESGWCTGNTNMIAALDKAEESFLNKDSNSNRTIILLSDGIPTSDGNTRTYYDDSEETIRYKLGIIKNNTINKVKKVVNGGTKVYALISKSDDEVNQWAKDIFDGNATRFRNVEEGNEVVNEITNEIKSFIISSTEQQEYIEELQIIQGVEDANRRQIVDSNFADKTFYYANSNTNSIKTSLFQQIENYNNLDAATELSELTKMWINGGKYKLDTIDHELGEFTTTKTVEVTDPNTGETVIDPDTGEPKTVTYTYINVYQEGSLKVGNVYLAQRPALSLVTKTTATALQVVLADHQILESQVQKPESTLPLIQVLDDEISHGATIITEYAITVKNQSSIQCNHLELVAYLPLNFVYRANNKLISKSGTNQSEGWTLVAKDQLVSDGYITSYTAQQNKNREAIKIVLDNNGKGKNGFYIPSGGEYTVRVNISTVISNLSSWQGDSHLYAEIIGYENSANRRMAYPQLQDRGTYSFSELVGVYPGNNYEQDFSGAQNSTNSVYVLPPTGTFLENYSQKAILTTIVVIVIAALTILLIRKYFKDEKNN